MHGYDLRPGERRLTAFAFATLATFMAGHTVLETARDTLFLRGLPSRQLPWAYLAIAALAIGAAHLGQRIHQRAPRKALGGTLAGFATLTALGWLAAPSPGPAGLMALYVWTGLVATVVVIQFWLRLGRIFTASQARRTYSVVAAGGLVGAIGGSAIAVRIVGIADPDTLPAVSAGLFAVAAFLSLGLPAGEMPRAAAPRGRARRDLRMVAKERYGRRLLLLIFVSTITVTAVDYLFKDLVWRVVPTEQLGWFFSRYYAVVNVLALTVQLAVAPRLFRSTGVHRALLVVPTLLGLAATGFGASALVLGALSASTFWSGATLKALDGAARHSLTRTGLELLYMPMGRRAREAVKATIDSVGQRGGQAAASVALLTATGLGAGPTELAAAIVLGALAWVILVLRPRREYLGLFRARLQEGSLPARREIRDLDLESVEEIVGALSSTDDRRVIAALDLLEQYGKQRLVPSLMLYHPSRDVALHAFALFGRAPRPDVAEAALRLLEHDDAEIRAAALRAHATDPAAQPRLRAALDDPDGSVRTTALVCLMARGDTTEAEDVEQIRCIVDGTCEDTRLALARAIRHLPAEPHGWVHRSIAATDDPVVALEAARSMAEQPHPAFLSELVGMLEHQQLRATARRAIVAIGAEQAIPFLAERLRDPAEPAARRKHLPRTLSLFRDPVAARCLLEQLVEERDRRVVHKILRGLGRMRALEPELPLDRSLVLQQIDRTLRRAIESLDRKIAVGEQLPISDPPPGGRLMRDLHGEREGRAIEHVFRLMHLLHPMEDFHSIHDALASGDRGAGSASRELLVGVVSPELADVTRDAVLTLVDDIPDSMRLERVLGFHRPPEHGLDYARRLEAMLFDDDELVRGIAAYHVGELGLEDLRSSIAEAAPTATSYGDLLDRALALLDRAPTGELPHAP